MKKVILVLLVLLVVSAVSAETKKFPGFENLELNTETFSMTYTYVMETESLSPNSRRINEVRALGELSRVLKEVFEIPQESPLSFSMVEYLHQENIILVKMNFKIFYSLNYDLMS